MCSVELNEVEIELYGGLDLIDPAKLGIFVQSARDAEVKDFIRVEFTHEELGSQSGVDFSYAAYRHGSIFPERAADVDLFSAHDERTKNLHFFQ